MEKAFRRGPCLDRSRSSRYTGGSHPKSPMPDSNFELDPRLAADTRFVGDLALSRVLLINDSNYPWLLLVPRRRGVSEITDLGHLERAHLMTEITAVADALKAETNCDKLNIAALGNVVPQLHVHIIARSHNDAAWPRPVWGHAPAQPYSDKAAGEIVARLHKRIWFTSERR